MIISILQNKGEEFDDSASFKKFSDGMSLADWRRMNVNNFVKYCSYSIKAMGTIWHQRLEFGVTNQ
jgi:uncharacterized lipoprotein YddW (UPF0748 family)